MQDQRHRKSNVYTLPIRSCCLSPSKHLDLREMYVCIYVFEFVYGFHKCA